MFQNILNLPSSADNQVFLGIDVDSFGAITTAMAISPVFE
jgi:hypothetical protein